PDVTGRLARYKAEARDRNLAPHVAREGKHRILDTMAAMVSGSRLKPGQMAIRYALAQRGVAEATVLATDIMTSAVNAALVNGVTAAIMVQLGFTGVWDVLDGEHNALQALSADPKPEEMVAGLGSRFFVTETAIKPFSVGYPIQAPLDAFLTLQREHGLNESS